MKTLEKLKQTHPTLTDWDTMTGRNKKTYFVAENSKQEIEVFDAKGVRVPEEEQFKQLF